jgi:plastocyanin
MKFVFSKPQWFSIVLATLICFATSLAIVTPGVLAETYTVKMGSDNGNLVFQPATITVKRGDVVQWVNNKLSPHNVMFDGKKMPAEEAPMAPTFSHPQLMIKTGETYELAISENLALGEYSYFCAPHRGAGMVAKIIVEG